MTKTMTISYLKYHCASAADSKRHSEDYDCSRLNSFQLLVSFCSLTEGITPKIADCVFVLINSVLLNLFCVWILL